MRDLAASAACPLCGQPAETQSHIQCLCPANKEVRIRARFNMAQRLWKGIKDSTKGWTIVTEQTVASRPATASGARGARRLHLHHRLHSAGLRPAPGLGWVSVGCAMGNVQASSSPSATICGPPPGIRSGRSLSVWLGRRTNPPPGVPMAVLPPLPIPFSYYPSPRGSRGVLCTT